MPRKVTVLTMVSVAVLGLAAGVAYAPYHTQPTPPPSGDSGSSSLAAAIAQAKTAAAHAGYAAGSNAVGAAKEHLGHALVCIEGAKGENVNAAWDNPCQGMGNGVLADLRRANASAALMAKAKDADAAAVAGMKSTDLAKIKTSAQQVATLMQQVAQGK
ncbi:MAG: hypothetical protein QN141_04380 [Armatimonadota bacterium]|nr:hypothetical protein [Armatimonadota bacterium]MDR7450601.1 hypothetical protein [Armatimonadota bacterium]MDR7466266.1 hypothetical protein [Armatimonadota bacterium]MDR7492987.1 hypothetical protein [Armatimonadota bacterium]MDR7498256.1 hypothetical protein [Armatimonadota bacterium]